MNLEKIVTLISSSDPCLYELGKTYISTLCLKDRVKLFDTLYDMITNGGYPVKEEYLYSERFPEYHYVICDYKIDLSIYMLANKLAIRCYDKSNSLFQSYSIYNDELYNIKTSYLNILEKFTKILRTILYDICNIT